MKNRTRDLREDADMRQIGLANAVGIDQRTISNYETGKSYPDSFALIKLADYFHVSKPICPCQPNRLFTQRGFP